METQEPQMNFDLGANGPVTLQQMEALCKRLAEAKEEAARATAAKKAADTIVTECELSIIAALEGSDMFTFKSKYGTATRQLKTSVRLPQTDAEKAQFFDWLKQEDLFDKMISVNSRSLNSLYSEKFEAAKELGEGVEFSIPGLNHVTAYEELSFRRV